MVIHQSINYRLVTNCISNVVTEYSRHCWTSRYSFGPNGIGSSTPSSERLSEKSSTLCKRSKPYRTNYAISLSAWGLPFWHELRVLSKTRSPANYDLPLEIQAEASRHRVERSCLSATRICGESRRMRCWQVACFKLITSTQSKDTG